MKIALHQLEEPNFSVHVHGRALEHTGIKCRRFLVVLGPTNYSLARYLSPRTRKSTAAGVGSSWPEDSIGGKNIPRASRGEWIANGRGDGDEGNTTWATLRDLQCWLAHQAMAALNTLPIIFPLSNPVKLSGCTYEDAVKYTDGRVLFASGSPFYEIQHKGKTLYPGQGNNMYIFPGLGLGAILARCSSVSDSMVEASSTGRGCLNSTVI
ncbi:malic enzyme, NAD binding domain-containing protein [Mycena haematopus]|nr:malic enzyme, NAD binding domain-containing protein [Mycena haematopus]